MRAMASTRPGCKAAPLCPATTARRGVRVMTYRLLYASSATAPFTQPDLDALLTEARSRNEARGLCGALWYHDSLFFQVLEGAKSQVKELWSRLQQDRRHHILLFVEQDDVAALFHDWRMAWVAPSGFSRLGFDPALLARHSINDEEVQELLAHFRRAAQLEAGPSPTPADASGTAP